MPTACLLYQTCVRYKRHAPAQADSTRPALPSEDLFGTEANVRLLRVLVLHPTPFTSGELARRAMLGRTSVYPALRVLERAGIVEHVGVGSQKLVQLRVRHPLSQHLRELFRAEAQRVGDLTDALRRLPSTRDPRVLSAWIDEAPNAESDVLTLYVVARPEDLDALVDQLNADVADVGRTHDVHIAVHGLTRSEVGSVLSPSRLEHIAPRLVGGVPRGATRPPAARHATTPADLSPGARRAVAQTRTCRSRQAQGRSRTCRHCR